MKQISYLGNNIRRKILWILSFFIVAGIAAGSVYQAVKAPEPSFLIHQYAAPLYSGMSVSEYFAGGFIQNALVLAILLLFGFFSFGQPFGAALLVCRGFGIGSSSAMLYAMFGKKALFSIMILVLPKSIALMLVWSVAVREQIRASNHTLSGWMVSEKRAEKELNFRLYCIRFLVLIALALVISAADAALNVLFAGIG